MDLTQLYIEMCEQADEVQENYQPQQGDYTARSCEYGYKNRENRIGLISWNRDMGREQLRWRILTEEDGITLGDEKPQDNYLHKMIWLPRQDQLQELVPINIGTFRDNFYTIFSHFSMWALNEKNLNYIALTPEQLWLIYIMRLRFNKQWNGYEWVVIDNEVK